MVGSQNPAHTLYSRHPCNPTCTKAGTALNGPSISSSDLLHYVTMRSYPDATVGIPCSPVSVFKTLDEALRALEANANAIGIVMATADSYEANLVLAYRTQCKLYSQSLLPMPQSELIMI